MGSWRRRVLRGLSSPLVIGGFTSNRRASECEEVSSLQAIHETKDASGLASTSSGGLSSPLVIGGVTPDRRAGNRKEILVMTIIPEPLVDASGAGENWRTLHL